MASDVRIQLEGQLERVERAVRTWEKVAQSLRGETWRTGALFPLLDAIAPEVEAAAQQVQRKAGDAPELQKLLDRLARAQAEVHDRALTKLGRVGAVPASGSTRDVLAELRREYPIVHQERLGWKPWQAGLMAVVFGLAGFAMSAAPHSYWLVALAMGLALPAWMWWLATPVLLTARTLVVGGEVVPLDDLLLVTARIAGVPNRRGKQCELELVSRSRAIRKISSSGKPTKLIAALRARGVKVDVEEGWTFFW